MRSVTFLRGRRVRGAIVVAYLAAAGARSHAQTLFETIPQAECSASDLVGYDFKVTAASLLVLCVFAMYLCCTTSHGETTCARTAIGCIVAVLCLAQVLVC